MENSIIENTLRVGRFTSSEIWKLTKKDKSGKGFGAPALTYIEEKQIEKRMGVSLKQDVYSRPMAWGHLIELWVHNNVLGLDYVSCGKETLQHPTCEWWVGSPDFKSERLGIVADCKGYERKKFAQFADVLIKEDVELFKTEFEEEYWQLVSNAIILGYDKIQTILFMPYKSQLEVLSDFVSNIDGIEQFKYKYVYDAVISGQLSQLPYLPDNGYYKNCYAPLFEVPQSDKDLLSERIYLAGKLLQF